MREHGLLLVFDSFHMQIDPHIKAFKDRGLERLAHLREYDFDKNSDTSNSICVIIKNGKLRTKYD